MTIINTKPIARMYANNGQHAEQIARCTLTGKIEKADNRPFYLGGDCGDIQIKSARATICKGDDLGAYLDQDGANRYGYVTADFKTLYLMDRREYETFATAFSTRTCESAKNGGAVKLRLKHESSAMREWLASRAH